MAIISYALTLNEYLSGLKTRTSRDWSDRTFNMWCRFWDEGKRIHDAWDKNPRAGGKRIGSFLMTARPYREKLCDMPPEDLIAEGGMCATVEEFCEFIGQPLYKVMAVIRFEKI